MPTPKKKPTGAEAVNDYMLRLTHPLKAEMEIVRSIILGVDPRIAERVKWNAPSFYYHDDLVVFHPRALDCVHLVFVFHRGKMIEERFGLLEGDYKDRRMAKFHGMEDINARRSALEQVVRLWVEMTDVELNG